MTRLRKRGWRELIVLLAALACAGSWAASQVRSMRDRSEVAKMTEKMKTVCVGRYLVDVPARAEVSFSGSMIDGFEIASVEESAAAFEQRIAAREAEIAATPADPATGTEGGMVEARDLRVSGLVGRTFIHAHSRGYMMEGDRRIELESVSVESHAHLGGMSFTLSASPTVEASASEAEALLARIQLRGEAVPAATGFCVPHAVFVDPLPAHSNEHIVMHVGLAEHPDLGVTLASLAGTHPAPGLLARIAQTDAAASADLLLRITKLHAGKRIINGLEGEEVLLRAREFNFTTTYGFNWEAPGEQGNLSYPYLSLELRTGVNERAGGAPVDTSLHEDALLALWRSISSSIRLRENGPPPRTSPLPEPPGPPLGTVAIAGDVCIQSGWWRCTDDGSGFDVHGGRLRYLRKGERMPQALLLPRQTLWQKLKRVQPSVESTQASKWTLLDRRVRPRVSSSIPLAPVGMPVAGVDASGEPAGEVPLNTVARTGEDCPASGWWRCAETSALDGTRWFPRGALLPAASFRVPAGAFQKSAGPDIIQRRSVWELMRHATSAEGTMRPNLPEEAEPAGLPPAET